MSTGSQKRARDAASVIRCACDFDAKQIRALKITWTKIASQLTFTLLPPTPFHGEFGGIGNSRLKGVPQTSTPTKETTLESVVNSSTSATLPSDSSSTTSSASTPTSKASLTSTSDFSLSDPSPNSSPNSKLSESSDPTSARIDDSESEAENVLGRNVSQNIVQGAEEGTNVTASAPFTPQSSPSSSPWPMSSPSISASSCSSPSNTNTPNATFHSHSPNQSGSMTFTFTHLPSTSPNPNPNPNPTRLLFPRILTKPPFKPVQSAVISALDPDLESIPLAYITNTLKRVGPRMMAALARTSATIPNIGESNANGKTTASAQTLPRELVVTVSPESDKEKGSSWFHDPDTREQDISMEFDTLPTHLLAVYSRSPNKASSSGNVSADGNFHHSRDSNNQRRKVTLFPTHAIILAVHCANLPALPPGRKLYAGGADGRRKKSRDSDALKRHFGVDIPESILESEAESNVQESNPSPEDDNDKQGIESAPGGVRMNGKTSGTEVTLPIVPLCIPSPGTFPILQAYLYTKRTDRLLAAIIPAIPSFGRSEESTGLTDVSKPRSSVSTPAFASSPADLSKQLSMTFTPNILLAATLRAHEIWANVAALGIFDDNLWNVINYAWKVLVGSLEVVQMKMKTPVKSVLPQIQIGRESSVIPHVHASQFEVHPDPVSQRPQVPADAKAGPSSDMVNSQSDLFSPPLPSMPSLVLSSERLPTPTEGQEHGKQG